MEKVSREEILDKIINFCENTFLEGTRDQIKNYRNLIVYLSSIRVNTSLFDIDDYEKLVKSSPKIYDMLLSILSLNDCKVFLENDFFCSLALTFSNISGIKVNELEEEIESESNYRYDVDALKSKDIDLVRLYLSDIGQVSLLSVSEEKELFERLANGDKLAREKLIESNLRLVVSIAKRFPTRGMDILDLIQEGNKGLMKAVEKYDYQKGFKFSTYATWWIRQAITRAIADSSKVIRIPVHMNETIIKVKKVMYKYAQHHNGESPTTEDIAEILGMTVEKVEECFTYMQEVISLNAPVRVDEGPEESEMGEFIEDTNCNVEEECIGRIQSEQMRKLLTETPILSDREKDVIFYRFGFYDGHRYTLEEIGAIYNLTRERIRQIEAKAIRKLRMNPKIKSYDPNPKKPKKSSNEYYPTNGYSLSKKIV